MLSYSTMLTLCYCSSDHFNSSSSPRPCDHAPTHTSPHPSHPEQNRTEPNDFPWCWLTPCLSLVWGTGWSDCLSQDSGLLVFWVEP